MFQNYINSVAKSASKLFDKNEKDFIGNNGLLCCAICKTPRQARIKILGKEQIVNCLCRCRTEKRDAEYERHKKAKINKRNDFLKEIGFPDKKLKEWTFENSDKTNKKLSDIAINYILHFDEMKKEGKGLLFYGPVGTGKTFISACIVNGLIDLGHSCLMTNFSRLTNTLQGMYDGRQEYIDSLNRFDLLVIDDLASERDTGFMNEVVHSIIDNRYRSGLPIIVTTNLTGNELKNATEIQKQRIYSRLFEMCAPVEVKGPDRRKAKLKDAQEYYAQTLGI